MGISNGIRKSAGAISINKIMLFALIGGLVALGVISFFMMMDMRKHDLTHKAVKDKPSASQKKAVQFKPIEVSKIKKVKQLKDYDIIVERNPFAPYEGAVKGKGEGKAEAAGGKQKKSSILSETPEFLYRGSVKAGGVLKCALEDVETKEIYFLKKGDNIGEYFVLDIQQDKVILSQKKGGGELVVPLFE